MWMRMYAVIAGLVLLAACGPPLAKRPLLTGCEAAAQAVAPELIDAALDYRAVVGREAILRFLLPQSGGEPRLVNVKCKVALDGDLKRIMIDARRARGHDLDKAKAAFDQALGR
jgi:hypothetical protein